MNDATGPPMNEAGILNAILKFYPKAIHCKNGHIGREVVTIERELDDDREREIRVVRCGHCNLPLRDEYV